MENSETGYKNLLPTHKRIKIEFLKTGKIFTDDEFPAADKSLFILNDNKTKKKYSQMDESKRFMYSSNIF